jgi:D-cysteine desulfhydrase
VKKGAIDSAFFISRATVCIIKITQSGGAMSLQNLTRFPRLELIGAPTPLEYLPRLSDHLGAKFLSNVMM